MKSINKVIFVISNISIGGAQRITLILAEWLIKNGIDTKVVAVGESTGNYNIPEIIDVKFLGHSSNKKIVRTIYRLSRILKEEAPQLVITMGVTTCLFSVPAIKMVPGIKHIISERNDPRHFLGKLYVGKLSHLFMRSGDGFVFQTDEAKNYYSVKIQNKGIVIPNPILTANIPDALNEPKKNYIVTMGRLTKQKNHKILIDAFDEFYKCHSNYELHIYGSGELENITKEYASRKKSSKSIVFFEACNNVLECIKDAQIFVLSSDFEGMPNALMEAMAMGLPVISTDCPCGGPRYLVKDKTNGLLFPVGDTKKLVSLLDELADNEQLRMSIAREAIKIKNELCTEKISLKWFEYLRHILKT